VREVGTHQELLQKRGIYFKLYELQYKDQELPKEPVPCLTPEPPHPRPLSPKGARGVVN